MIDDVVRCACGATLAAGRSVVPAVLRPRPEATSRFGPAPLAVTSDPSAAQPLPDAPRQYSRFQATDVTFGPVGRTVVTILVLAPAVAFITVGLLGNSVAGIVGVVVYGGAIIPRALRELWRRQPDRLH